MHSFLSSGPLSSNQIDVKTAFLQLIKGKQVEKTLICECICQPLMVQLPYFSEWASNHHYGGGPRPLRLTSYTTVNKTQWEKDDEGSRIPQLISHKVLITGFQSPINGVKFTHILFPLLRRTESKALTLLLGEIYDAERHKIWSMTR